MNYHIMIQDKFLDSFIDDVYEINEDENNIFWFRGLKDENDFIKTKKTVEYLGNNTSVWREKFSNLNPSDSIFVHWYDFTISKILYDLPNPIYVLLWGGEFYNEPFWYHKWVFDRLTLKFLKYKLNYPKLEITFNFRFLYNEFKKLYFLKREIKNDYNLKNKLVGRIDYFIFLDTNNNFFQDYHRIKKLYPLFKAKNLPGFYDQNFDRALFQNEVLQKTNPNINILLGNSASEPNNHLDALEKMKNLKNVIIYCPLSYGGTEEYIDLIIQRGKDLFGVNFIPIQNFMSREDYMKFYDSIDVVFMYHNRQQAFGNVCTALTKGKPVFLKKQNTIKGHLDALQIKTYNANNIAFLNLNEIIEESKKNSFSNYQILKNTISKEKRLSDLKNIMDNIKHHHNF